DAKERSIGRQDTLLSSIRRNRTFQCHRDWQRRDYDRPYAHVAFEERANAFTRLGSVGSGSRAMAMSRVSSRRALVGPTLRRLVFGSRSHVNENVSVGGLCG